MYKQIIVHRIQIITSSSNQINYYCKIFKKSTNDENTFNSISEFNFNEIDISQYFDSLNIDDNKINQEYYEVEEVSNEIRLKFNNRDDIQVLMKCIKRNNCDEWLTENINIGTYYDYKKFEDSFEIKQDFRDKISI